MKLVLLLAVTALVFLVSGDPILQHAQDVEVKVSGDRVVETNKDEIEFEIKVSKL